MIALIVDDEFKAREILELMIKLHIPEFKKIRLASSGPEASQVLQQCDPDVVFLDVKMPVMNGFEWLASLPKRPFDVVFTTAYDQYAIQAIRYSAFDYLLKPVDPEDLRTTMNRYLKSTKTHAGGYDNLLYNIGQNDPSTFRLTISTTQGTHYLDSSEIIRCEADGNYTHFYLTNEKHIIASRPLGHYGSLLPDNIFIRCHKSSLVNRNYIKTIYDKQISLADGSIVEVSRRRLAAVKKAMSN